MSREGGSGSWMINCEKKYSSKPFNPKLANIFFLSGMIEAWGRGFDKIKAACDEYEGELPEYDISEDGIMVYCKACDAYISLMKEDIQGKNNVTDNSAHLCAELVKN